MRSRMFHRQNGSRPRLRWSATAAVCLGAVLAHNASLAARGQSAPKSTEPRSSRAGSVPAEERRLDARAFHRGLRERGLLELLELHLGDFPPKNRISSLELQRELYLERARDPSASRAERLDAFAGANRILEGLIELSKDSVDRWEWQLALGRSLIYDEARPYFLSILERGDNESDRVALLELTRRAVPVLDALVKDLTDEFVRVEELSLKAFERLERAGLIERMDALEPEARYRRLWAWFFHALARADGNPERTRLLHLVLDTLTRSATYLQTPLRSGLVQIPSRLLAGMTCRRLNDHASAREHLERAITLCDRVSDPTQRKGIEWVLRLAWIERIRNERDAADLDAARKQLTRFVQLIETDFGDDFELREAAALVERSIHRARANVLKGAGRNGEAKRAYVDGWRALTKLIKTAPERRGEVYDAVNHLVDPGGATEGLDPVELAAVVAGALSTSRTAEGGEREALLRRAVRVADVFLSRYKEEAKGLTPELLFNAGVASFELGEMDGAVERFVAVARDHPDYEHALRASTFAVQILAESYNDPALSSVADLRRRYIETLDLLITGHPRAKVARYYRFYYGQALEDAGQYERAARQYRLVDEDHEHRVEAMFLRLRTLAAALTEEARANPRDEPRIRKGGRDIADLHRKVISALTDAIADSADDARAAVWRSLLGEAAIIAAEVRLLPQIDRPAKALQELADFEKSFPDQRQFVGRVLRVRLVAYEKLGRFDDATAAIPAYIASDPERAGPTLQSLFVALTAEVRRLREAGDEEAALRKAKAALVIAEQLDDWARRRAPSDGTDNRLALSLQLAEANLLAGQFERSADLFEKCIAEETDGAGFTKSKDQRAMMGLAEARFLSEAFADALPIFNRITVGTSTKSRVHWQALLRDLQCRTSLRHPPVGIIKVIAQQLSMDASPLPADIRIEFERLKRRNEARRDAHGASDS